MNISKHSGNLLIATGIFHNVIGVVMGWPVLTEMVSSGFINSINDQMDRNAIFWFLFSGFMMIILGTHAALPGGRLASAEMAGAEPADPFADRLHHDACFRVLARGSSGHPGDQRQLETTCTPHLT